MATYQPVMNNTWDDPAFQQWTPNAKLVFFNLLTSHRNNPLGLYAVTYRSLADETSLPDESLTVAMTELRTPFAGYARVEYDEQRFVVWIVNVLRHQKGVEPSNRNVVVHIRSLLAQYAECSLTERLQDYYAPKGYGWLFDRKGLARGLQGATKGPNRIGKDRIGKDRSTTTDVKHDVTTKVEQPHQTLITRFLELKGTPRTGLAPAQVTGAFRRHSRSALALIGEAGGLDHALVALTCAATYFDRKHLTWTIDTVARHLPNLRRYGEELNGADHGLTPHQVDQFRKLAAWVQSSAGEARAGAVPGVAAPSVPHVPSG